MFLSTSSRAAVTNQLLHSSEIAFRMFRPTIARLAAAASNAKPVWQGADHPVRKIAAQPFAYRFFAKGVGASMWFFLLYRAKEDGAALIGLKHPWDH